MVFEKWFNEKLGNLIVKLKGRLYVLVYLLKFKIFSVTSNEGIYVLQWKYYDKLAHTHLSPLDSLTNAAHTHTHKAKVMYYYETLNSIDYKGSMTSLQSCQSGFSSISKHSTSGVSSGMSSSHSEKLPRSLVSNMDHSNGKKWKFLVRRKWRCKNPMIIIFLIRRCLQSNVLTLPCWL